MRYHRVGRSAAVGLALAALAAPSAGAQQQDSRSPDARAGVVSKTSSLAGTTSDTKVGEDLRSPDGAASKTSSLAGTTSDTKVGQDLRSPDARQAVGRRHGFNVPVAAVAGAPQPSADGIDLGDAAIGAGALFGLMALSLGGSLAVVHRRRQTATTG
jgi:hypothetical protein